MVSEEEQVLMDDNLDQSKTTLRRLHTVVSSIQF